MSRRLPEDRNAASRCPICSAPTAPALEPFCSRRCADVDLARWLTGSYAIASTSEVDENDDADMAMPRDGEGERRGPRSH